MKATLKNGVSGFSGSVNVLDVFRKINGSVVVRIGKSYDYTEVSVDEFYEKDELKLMA